MVQSLLYMIGDYLFFFFFQAEDGIRDYKVTGVQTCALPISGPAYVRRVLPRRLGTLAGQPDLEGHGPAGRAQADPPGQRREPIGGPSHDAREIELADAAPRVAAARGVPGEQVEDPEETELDVLGQRHRSHPPTGVADADRQPLLHGRPRLS